MFHSLPYLALPFGDNISFVTLGPGRHLGHQLRLGLRHQRVHVLHVSILRSTRTSHGVPQLLDLAHHCIKHGLVLPFRVGLDHPLHLLQKLVSVPFHHQYPLGLARRPSRYRSLLRRSAGLPVGGQRHSLCQKSLQRTLSLTQFSLGFRFALIYPRLALRERLLRPLHFERVYLKCIHHFLLASIMSLLGRSLGLVDKAVRIQRMALLGPAVEVPTPVLHLLLHRRPPPLRHWLWRKLGWVSPQISHSVSVDFCCSASFLQGSG